MAKLIVMYGTPKDPGAFDSYYFATHVPIAKRIPGLRKYEVSEGAIGTPAGPAPTHLTAILHFDSMPDIQAAMMSPEGQAAAGDMANFADGGAELVFFDDRTI